jgi:hypothetical protein
MKPKPEPTQETPQTPQETQERKPVERIPEAKLARALPAYWSAEDALT